MSNYGVHKFLRTCLHDLEFRKLALNEPETALSRMPLSEDEKAAMRAGDVAWLYEHGVHAFLLSFLTRWNLFGVTNELYTQRIHEARDSRLSN